MSRRNDLQRRCTQAKDLIQDNKYVPALELIDTLPLEEVSSVEDLYLFADLYEKAEKLNKKKEIFLLIYNLTHSRRILKRLIRLTIRMGDVEEARQLFLAYEMKWEVTLDTYELRYMLARAEGEPREKLIEILEELKQEEYTEKWGYQLARLYEQEGQREKCIRECRDLELWFGEGRIVDKASALREKCERSDWQQPKDEEIPEPEKGEDEDVLGLDDLPEEEAARLELERTEEESEQEEVPEVLEPEEKREAKEVLEEQPQIQEVLEPEVQPPVQEVLELQERPQMKEVLEPEGQPPVQEILEPEAPSDSQEILKPEVRVEVKQYQRRQKIPFHKDIPKEDIRKEDLPTEEGDEEDPEDISERGIRYYTIKSTINHMRQKEGNPHIVFAGGEERIVMTVSKRMAKELRRLGYFSAKNFAKTTAGKLNKLNLADQMTKLEGSCLLVLEAPSMSKKTVESMKKLLDEQGDRIVIMLAGDFDEMDCFLSMYPALAEKFLYKIHM